jgi:hypothetical protein
LSLSLHKEGYRVGLWFEDQDWGYETWQGKHLRSMGYLTTYAALENVKAKVGILLDSTAQGVILRAVEARHLRPDGTVVAPCPDVTTTLAQFHISPNWDQHTDMLTQTGQGRALVFARPSVDGFEPLQGTAFAWNAVPTPDRADTDALVLLRGGWSEEDIWEAAMYARHLGRNLHCVDIAVADLPECDLRGAKVYTPSAPLTPATGPDLVQAIVRQIAAHYSPDTPLDSCFQLLLPAEGL